MGKYLDFDAFLLENEQEPILVKIYGTTYPVRPEIPAIVPILMARAEDEEDESAGTRLVLRAADALLGRQAMDEIAGRGMSVEELAELIRRLFALIQGEDAEAAEEIADDAGRHRRAGKK